MDKNTKVCPMCKQTVARANTYASTGKCKDCQRTYNAKAYQARKETKRLERLRQDTTNERYYQSILEDPSRFARYQEDIVSAYEYFGKPIPEWAKET